jgi:hypothetical protein
MQSLHSCGDVWKRVVVANGPLVESSVVHDDLFFLAILLPYEVDQGGVW